MDTFSILLLLLASFSTIHIIQSQQLTPSDDKMYLDTLESEMKEDVAEAKDELVRHAKSVQTVTQNYAKAKLTENMFKALRVLAEKELERIPMQYRIRQPRQEEAEEGGGGSGGDDEDSGEASSGGSSAESGTGSSTARTVPLIPVLAGILKSVFGGGANATTTPLNVTHTLQHATKLLFPLGNPFKNIIRNRRPTAAPATIIKYYPLPVYSAPAAPSPQPTIPSTVRTTTPRLRLVGRARPQRSIPDTVSPPSIGINEPATPPTNVPALSKLSDPNRSTIYGNMESLYAPAYLPLPVFKPNPESPSAVTVASPPMFIYAPNYQPQQPIYAPNHSNSQSQVPATITQPSILESSVTSTSKPKARPQIESFIPAFAETVAIAESKPAKIPTKTEPTHVTVESIEISTKRIQASTTLGTTEAPKAGLIYVDSLARDVQTGLDGLVKNLPDILKGAKEAIGLLANLREIFGEEEDG